MKKGSKHSDKTKALLRESNKDSIRKALDVKLAHYIRKYPKRADDAHLYLKARNLLRDFGMSLTEYNVLFEKQKGCCAICGVHQSNIKNLKALCVDHDHNTGKIRGLLCDKCNRGLGLFSDSIALLDKAKRYISVYSTDGIEHGK